MNRPKIDEAVQHILHSKTDSYKRECLRYWRKAYGDAFADKVRAQALKKMRK